MSHHSSVRRPTSQNCRAIRSRSEWDKVRHHPGTAVLIMDSAQRDQVLGRIRGYLESRPETGSGAFALPMVTSALRSVRR